MSPKMDWLEGELERLEVSLLLREPTDDAAAATLQGLTNVCSNDYLGYRALAVSRETASPAGAGASRLIGGTHSAHLDLERAAAAWLNYPACLLFSSGYVANLSTIAALVGEGDAVFSDRLNHASIIDGARLSRAKVHVYDHLDLTDLAHQLADARGFRRRLVVSETYFSMDGDGPDLSRLAAIAEAGEAMLMLDEAHSLGVLGPEGRGRAAEAGVMPDLLVGTFGKALGTQGAFVVSSEALRTWLWNRARGFVFSTASSPWLATQTLQHLQRVQTDDDSRVRLTGLCAAFARDLTQLGVQLPSGRFGPIFPVLLGTAERALAASQRLGARGYLVQAVRPPTVPEATARLRITLNAGMTESTVTALAREVAAVCV